MKFTRSTLKEKQHEKLEFLLFCRQYVISINFPKGSCNTFWSQDKEAMICQIEMTICEILQEALNAQGKKTFPKV